jgi:hypothetical protein
MGKRRCGSDAVQVLADADTPPLLSRAKSNHNVFICSTFRQA